MDQLDINPRILTAARKAKLNDFCSILSLSRQDLERATQLSARDAAGLQRAVAEAVPRSPQTTGLALWQKNGPESLHIKRLSTGCPNLDRFLRGGVLSRGITEIAGESASGKTQVCLQLCLTVQLPISLGGLDGGVIYVCTEDAFPNKRLMQMSENFVQNRSNSPAIQKIRFTDNIFIEHAADMDDLRFCLMKKAPYLLERGLVRLVVIDSIAALFRCEFGAHEAVQRAKELTSLGAQLCRLSQQYNIPVVCVNQVSDDVSRKQTTSNSGGAARHIIPALGLSWANMVMTRLMLAKTHHKVSPSPAPPRAPTGQTSRQAGEVTVRTMEVLFAPHLPNDTCPYIVDSDGVKGLVR